jgi:hypothetical protein
MFTKKLLSVLFITVLSLCSYSADKFVTKRDSSQKTAQYRKVITFPHLFSNSVPAYSEINNQVSFILERNGCATFETASADNPYVYDVFARIIGLNSYFVGIEVKVNIDCDSPHHPVEGFYHLVFDSKSGDLVEIDEHVPLQTFNPDAPELIMQYQRELAELIYDELKHSGDLRNSCYHGITREEAVRFIEFDYPEISGLARFKNVVIKTSPSLENQNCREILRIAYDKVSQYIKDDSQLHQWLD